jgi:hypothetical protein
MEPFLCLQQVLEFVFIAHYDIILTLLSSETAFN